MKKPIGILGLSLVLLIIILGLKAQAQVYDYNFTEILAPFPGASWTLPKGINDFGHIVGSYQDGGFVRIGGVFNPVHVPETVVTDPWGINNLGDIVGVYYDASWPPHGFLKVGNTFSTIDFPGALYTNVHGINDTGIIVGSYYDGTSHGFVKIGDSFETIDFPGAGPLGTEAYGINNLGHIVGVYLDQSNTVHSFLKIGDTFTNIDVPEATLSVARGINDFGHIVGSYGQGSSGEHGFIKVGDEFITIDVDLPGIYGTTPFGINNSDQIVGGCGYFNEHGFLASPRLTLCNPPNNVYVDNSAAFGLFEGILGDIEYGLSTTTLVNIQATDLFQFPFLRPEGVQFWVSIEEIIYNPNDITVEPYDMDLIGGFFAANRLIAPGTHASFKASFCKPGTIIFELGFSEIAIGLTLADALLSIIPGVGKVPYDKVLAFADAIDNVPLVASSHIHISNAINAALDRKRGEAFKELGLAITDLGKLAFNQKQRNQLLQAIRDLGVDVTEKKLISALLRAPVRVFKIFGDAIVLAIQTDLGTAGTIQINVIGN
jgi:hypothetical protein